MIPDLSVLAVVFLVLILVGVLDRLLFKPVLRVMQAREGAIVSARNLAEESAAKATAAAAEFERETTAARTEVYKQMDEKRRAALERFVALPPSPLEKREQLEQLRALENGMRIDVTVVDSVPVEVNTPQDLELVRSLLAG